MAGSPLELKSFIFLQIAWRGSADFGTPQGFRRVDIEPSDEFPMGRKGFVFKRCWESMKEEHTQGILLLDSDVAIDPIDFQLMYNSMRTSPRIIHIGAARIWPKSTGYTQWVWAHRKMGTVYSEWQNYITNPDTASFCFTYLPAKLIEACISDGMEEWTFPSVDTNVFRVAREKSIKIHVIEGCQPKHMNY